MCWRWTLIWILGLQSPFRRKVRTKGILEDDFSSRNFCAELDFFWTFCWVLPGSHMVSNVDVAAWSCDLLEESSIAMGRIWSEVRFATQHLLTLLCSGLMDVTRCSCLLEQHPFICPFSEASTAFVHEARHWCCSKHQTRQAFNVWPPCTWQSDGLHCLCSAHRADPTHGWYYQPRKATLWALQQLSLRRS